MERRSEIVLRNGKLTTKTTRLPTKWTVERIQGILTEMLEWMREDNDNLFPSEFLLKNGYSHDLITQKIRVWERMDERDRPDLTEIYRLYSMAKKTSEMKTLKGGLTKKYDSAITKLTLSHHHGYREHIEQGAAGSSYIFQQNIINQNNDKTKSAADHARDYQQLVRGLPGGKPVSLQGPDEICADIE